MSNSRLSLPADNTEAKVLNAAIVRRRTSTQKPPPRNVFSDDNDTRKQDGVLIVTAKDFNDGPRRKKDVMRKERVPPRPSISLVGGVQKPNQKKAANVAQFVDDHRREIGRFGSKALLKKDRRAYEIEELTKLGCRPPKSQKMPIGLLQEKRKKEKEQLARKKQMDLESGMLIRSKRKRRK